MADDQPGELAWIDEILRESGHECQTFRNGEEVVAALRRESYDLLLLDWNMPQMDGIATLAWIQENLENPPPIIMLTSRDGKDDVVKALDMGACDFITKPEDANVVRARVAAALRRHSGKPGEIAVFGNFRFVRSTQTVEFGDEVIALRAKEFDLARLLFDNLDRPLSRGYLLQRIWNSSPDIETRTLDMHISRIRAKLQLGPERGFALRTVFGFGYRLDGSGNEVG